MPLSRAAPTVPAAEGALKQVPELNHQPRWRPGAIGSPRHSWPVPCLAFTPATTNPLRLWAVYAYNTHTRLSQHAWLMYLATASDIHMADQPTGMCPYWHASHRHGGRPQSVHSPLVTTTHQRPPSEARPLHRPTSELFQVEVPGLLQYSSSSQPFREGQTTLPCASASRAFLTVSLMTLLPAATLTHLSCGFHCARRGGFADTEAALRQHRLIVRLRLQNRS